MMSEVAALAKSILQHTESAKANRELLALVREDVQASIDVAQSRLSSTQKWIGY